MSKLTKQLDRRDSVVAKLQPIIESALAESRDYTPAEEAQRALFNDQLAEIDAKITSIRTAEAEADKAAEAANDDDEVTDDEKNEDETRAAKAERAQERKLVKDAEAKNARGDGNMNLTVGAGEHVYYEGGPYHYLQDLALRAEKQFSGTFNPQADYNVRLAQHAKEISIDAQEAQRRLSSGTRVEKRGFSVDRYLVAQTRDSMARNAGVSSWDAQFRDLSTAAGSGGEFVPPIYLTEQYVPYARAGRVFANQCHMEMLPPGTMSINIPKIQGGTLVSPQSTQNTNVADQDLETEYVTFPVITVAGAQILSLQLIERSPIDFTGVAFGDLTLAQAQTVDQQALVGTGANGQVTGTINTSGITSVNWPSGATATITALMGVITNAKAQIASSRFMPATDVFMTPTRWEYLEGQVDTNGRPLIVPMNNGPFNVIQSSADMAIAEGATGGRLLGLNVWQDANIPSSLGSGNNQDAILVTKTNDLYLYETPVIARALPQTYGAQLSVLIQLYNYVAFSAARYPNSVAYITGSGLTPPVFAN